MIHALLVEPFSEIAGDVAGTIVRQQPGFVPDMGLIAARGRERHLQRVGNVPGLHRGAQLPGNDVARVVVEDGGQVAARSVPHDAPQSHSRRWVGRWVGRLCKSPNH